MNPVEEFQAVRKTAVAKNQEKHLELWNAWKDNGQRPQELTPLMEAFRPKIIQKTREWRPPSIPEPVYHADLEGHLIKAFETYNPTKAALSTHVENSLMKSLRYTYHNQNFAYMPEQQTRMIGKIDKAKNILEEDLGRPPTFEEIAKHMGKPLSQIKRVEQGRLKDIAVSTYESDPTEHFSSRERELIDLLPEVLTNDEKDVFKHIFHQDPSKRITSTNVLAQRLGKNAPQISRLKTSILKKMDKYR